MSKITKYLNGNYSEKSLDTIGVYDPSNGEEIISHVSHCLMKDDFKLMLFLVQKKSQIELGKYNSIKKIKNNF